MLDNLFLEEDKVASYAPRTFTNASSADLTVAIAVDFNTHGERLTISAATRFCCIPWGTSVNKAAVAISNSLIAIKGSTLNIAGNGIYTFEKHNVQQDAINLYLLKVLQEVNKRYPITAIRSGGQTGMDMAALVAGCYMKIPTTGLFPKGYRQRYPDGVDRDHTKEQIEEQIRRWIELLN